MESSNGMAAGEITRLEVTTQNEILRSLPATTPRPSLAARAERGGSHVEEIASFEPVTCDYLMGGYS